MWYLNLPEEIIEIGSFAFKSKCLDPPPVFERIPEDLIKCLGLPPIRIYFQGKYKAAKESEILGMQAFRRVSKDSFGKYLLEIRPQMVDSSSQTDKTWV